MSAGSDILEVMKLMPHWVPLNGKQPGKGWENPRNWQKWEAVRRLPPPWGFVLNGSGLFCLDFDWVYDEGGRLISKAQGILQKVARASGCAYVERSLSGRGLHLFYRADVPAGAKHVAKKQLREAWPNGKVSKLEIFTGRGSARQIAVTGRQVEWREIVGSIHVGDGDGAAVLKLFMRDILSRSPSLAESPGAAAASRVAESPALDEPEVMDAIRRSKQAALFSALYDRGDTSNYNGDKSGADMALMCILAYWTGGNAAMMERLFSKSALAQREKWQTRVDYRQRTIARALATREGAFGEMAEKRFSWMKLVEDFFRQSKIRKIRQRPNGATYVLIYEMMMLQTINTNGRLTLDYLDDSAWVEIGLAINEKPEDVEETVKLLEKYGLLKIITNTAECVELEFPDLKEELGRPSAVSIGSETSSAGRKRKQRAGGQKGGG